MTTSPALRVLSLGAGVQSTTLLLLAAEGRLPKLDAAVFADTGWEPAAVYEHLDRLEREIAQPAGIPVYRVSAGNIRNDALDPEHRFASMPLFVKNPDGGDGMTRRQCTAEYKLKPIKAQVRRLLGYPHPTPIPRGVYAEQWVGISRDEFGRAKDSGIQYLKSWHPLLYLDGAADGREGWTREDCLRYLRANGWASTPKSACIGCPFHGNRQWRELRDHNPEEWADAVDFDHAIRSGNARGNANGKPLLGEAYLHASRLPLDQAPIDRVTWHEWKGRQTDLFDQIADIELEQGDPDGCSPWACRSGQPVDVSDAA
ncbi:adenine nucleotide alpha hydrolase family protein [Streptomyces sp. YIM S03343]